tara:strand:+ start:36 stop:371 length:336 start_codon:yes stop_codon:yes gene_type:complete
MNVVFDHTNVPMDRNHPASHKRPIFRATRPNLLNTPQTKTENCSMPDKKQAQHRVVLVKGDHHWRFEWESGDEITAVKAITEIAKSSETDFDWFDAAMVCHEMSKITAKAA